VKTKPDLHVAQWVRSQDEESLYLSVITIGEIQKGISKLPDGRKKKKQLQNWLSNDLKVRFKDRILEITIEIAHVWGHVLGSCEKKGISLPAVDSLIASQGIFHKMTIVTRNISDMEPSGVPLFNPWSA
jgi:hypothetical protein